MKEFLSKFGLAGLWSAKKSTFLGIGILLVGAVIDYLGESANPTAKLIAAIVSVPFLAWRGKLVADGTASIPTAPKGFATLAAAWGIVFLSTVIVLLVLGQYLAAGLLVLFGVVAFILAADRLARVSLLALALLVSVGSARAQDVPTLSGPFAVQIDKDWSLHLNVAVPAFGYSITQGKFLGRVAFDVAYVLDYRSKVAVGLGGGFVQTNDTPGAVFTGMLAGPVLPWKLADGVTLRPAGLYRYQWSGALHDQTIAGTLAFQF